MKIISIQDQNYHDSWKSFNCGVNELNEFLYRFARQNDDKRIGKTFLAIEEEQVVGYFTICTAEIGFSELPVESIKSLPKYPIPVVRLARLTVDQKYQHHGVGEFLLKQAMLKILLVAQSVGVYAILVDAKQSAVSFYKRYGFIELLDSHKTLFIATETVKKAFLSSF